jgi:hypothetical protein
MNNIYPSLFSFDPKLNPEDDFGTSKHEIPSALLSGLPVRHITIYNSDVPTNTHIYKIETVSNMKY